MQNKRRLFVMFAVPYRCVFSRLRLKQRSDFDLRTCARCSGKIFGSLRNITNSAGIRLAAKKIRRRRGAG